MHGGGYVIGSNTIDDLLFDDLCPKLGCVGVSVDYRLAPETSYPGPLEDCYRGLLWTHENAAELGIDPDRIGVAGVSAGGGLAAALALLARDRGEVPRRVPAPRLADARRPPDHAVEPAGRPAGVEPQLEHVRVEGVPRRPLRPHGRTRHRGARRAPT